MSNRCSVVPGTGVRARIHRGARARPHLRPRRERHHRREGWERIIDGGRGADTIEGGAGNDRLLGRKGNDSLADSSGTNTLRGGWGFDTCQGAGNILFNCETVT